MALRVAAENRHSTEWNSLTQADLRRPNIALPEYVVAHDGHRRAATELDTALYELACLEKGPSAPHWEIVPALVKVASCYLSLKSWQEAAAPLERALGIIEDALKSDSRLPDSINAVLSYSQDCQQQHLSRRERISNWLKRRSTGFKSRAESPHAVEPSWRPEAVALLRRIGNSHLQQQEFTEAADFFKYALAAMDRRITLDKELEARVTNNLGHVYFRLGLFREAESLYERSLAIVARYFAHDETKMRRRLINIASVQKALERNDKAVETLGRLAALYRSLGRCTEARQIDRKIEALGKLSSVGIGCSRE